MKQLSIGLMVIVILIVAVVFGKSYFSVTKNSEKSASIEPTENKKTKHMQISSTSFENQQKIPAKYTCTGESINPALEFVDIPEKAKSLVLIMDDPDAPEGTFVHWVVYNIDPATREIAENTKPAGTEGLNGAGKQDYIGPCPPPASPEQLQRGESGTHRYFFKLYALDTMLVFSQTPDKKSVEEKMQEHIIDQTELIGLYSKE